MKDFEAYMQKQNLSAYTIYEYLGAVRRFRDWYRNTYQRELDVVHLSGTEILRYRSELIHSHTASTVNKYLAAIRKWLEMYHRKGMHFDFSIPDVKIQRKNRSPRWLKTHEINAILYGVEQVKNDFLRARDRCMVYLGLYRGIRAGEQMLLKMEDVILTRGKQRIVIREGKGGKYDEVSLVGSRKVIGAIQDWIDKRSLSKFASSPYFFISERSGNITSGAVEKMVERIRKRSGVHFTTHQLRHTFLYHFQKITNDLRLTHEVARHSSIQTTLIYTQPTDAEIDRYFSAVENFIGSERK